MGLRQVHKAVNVTSAAVLLFAFAAFCAACAVTSKTDVTACLRSDPGYYYPTYTCYNYHFKSLGGASIACALIAFLFGSLGLLGVRSRNRILLITCDVLLSLNLVFACIMAGVNGSAATDMGNAAYCYSSGSYYTDNSCSDTRPSLQAATALFSILAVVQFVWAIMGCCGYCATPVWTEEEEAIRRAQPVPAPGYMVAQPVQGQVMYAQPVNPQMYQQPYNPNQPQYNPNQPQYNPNQPQYNPNQPQYNPNQPQYNPTQAQYAVAQPYNPNQPPMNQPNPNQFQQPQPPMAQQTNDGVPSYEGQTNQ